MKTLTLYVRHGCCLCRTAQDVLNRVREEYPFDLDVFEVDALPRNDPRRSTYALDIPVVEVDGEAVLRTQITVEEVIALVAGPEGT